MVEIEGQSQPLNKKLLKMLKSKKWKTCEKEKGIAAHTILLSIAWDLNPRPSCVDLLGYLSWCIVIYFLIFETVTQLESNFLYLNSWFPITF